jgi:hypothetical protein
MGVFTLFLVLLAASTTSNFYTQALRSAQKCISSYSYRHSTALNANPINADGSKYRGDITEEEAFLWFDEAMVCFEYFLLRKSAVKLSIGSRAYLL